MKFGEKIRAARLKRGFSQKELAGKAHIALRTIQNYESGERMPKSKETYAALARALDISEEMLRDEAAAETGVMPEVSDKPGEIIKYCRNCEWFCPVGSEREDK